MPPLITVVPPASVVRLLSRSTPPTAPLKRVVPDVFTRSELVSPAVLFSVLANVTLPAPLLSSVVALSRRTGSLYVWAPVVLTVPPLITVVPPASVVRLLSRSTPPTAPLKRVVPDVFTRSELVSPAGPVPRPADVTL